MQETVEHEGSVVKNTRASRMFCHTSWVLCRFLSALQQNRAQSRLIYLFYNKESDSFPAELYSPNCHNIDRTLRVLGLLKNPYFIRVYKITVILRTLWLVNRDAKPLFYCTGKPRFPINGSFRRELENLEFLGMPNVIKSFAFTGWDIDNTNIFSLYIHVEICKEKRGKKLVVTWSFFLFSFFFLHSKTLTLTPATL